MNESIEIGYLMNHGIDKYAFINLKLKNMKKIFALVVMTSCLFASCTKDSQGSNDLITSQQRAENNPNGGGGNNIATAPDAVLSAFNARYPDATRIEWKQLPDGNIKAEFFRGAVKWQAIFTASGTLVKEEHK